MIKKLKPDLTLLDISLPDQSGIELIRHIQHASSQTQVMIISMHSKIDYIVKAFQALNLHSTIEIARYAAKLGIIDIDLWKE